MKGCGPKCSVCPSKPRETKLFGRTSRDFCQDIPGAPKKKGEKKSLRSILVPYILLGPAFGRTDFSRIFLFEPPDFFADSLAGFFLLIFVGKSAQKNSLGKSPDSSPTRFCGVPEGAAQREGGGGWAR